MNQSRRLIHIAVACVLAAGCARTRVEPAQPGRAATPAEVEQVEIRRTTWGVPHIRADNLRAAAFALAYVQLEDHGDGIIRGMQAARGRLALVEGADRVDADARARQQHAHAVRMFGQLREDTRDVYAGFAAGMNHFIRMHRATLPAWVQPDFTAEDVLARDIGWPTDAAMNAFRRRLLADPGDPALLARNEAGEWLRVGSGDVGAAARTEPDSVQPDDGAGEPGSAVTGQDPQNVGSNAFALAPSRTVDGRTILLRNPHLAWTAGYYEAHVRVPGKLDFYGDFRIGGPFTVIGGFNPQLGFATTNNATRSHEFYALRADPTRADHVMLDGESWPLEREVVSVDVGDPAVLGSTTETREFWSSHIGPVVHRNDSLVYIYRPAANGEYRAGEQWLAMMQAASFDEWREAMRIEARTTSNFTYADRAGNIFYVWVSGAPLLPHPAGGDSLAVLVTRSDQVWSRTVAFDSLPQVLNPPGGYVRNENDSPHYTNLNRVLPDSFGFWVEPPRLRLRSQHGLALLHNDRTFSLEDVVTTKHSMRMLLADRVKADLIEAVAASNPSGDVARALALLSAWDNTAAAGSRGGVLFETWWNRYRSLVGGGDLHAVQWDAGQPIDTPRGLADRGRAVEAFVWAVPATARRFGAWDVAWGDVHRVRRGAVDAPVGGCSGALGCYRVLNFETAPDGKRVVNGGDGWVIAVEFGDPPRAYSVLGYGQSPDPQSPHHADQAEMFAAGRMKPVYWTEADIARATIRRYRPGAERQVSH